MLDRTDSSLSFVLTGPASDGLRQLGVAINKHPSVACHCDLGHPDPKKSVVAHQAYFGSGSDDPPAFRRGSCVSFESYLDVYVYAMRRRNEQSIGVVLPYSQLDDYGLWDYLRRKTRMGNFCVIHLTRQVLSQSMEDIGHAIALISTRDAARSVWLRCKQLDAYQARIRDLCEDRLEIDFEELVLIPNRVQRAAWKFLEVPDRQPFRMQIARGQFNTSDYLRIQSTCHGADRGFFEAMEVA